MEPSLRKSMALLHTWAGVVLGSVLFAIFWMGTLSVFDKEIDRWMMPTTRVSMPDAAVSLDKVVLPLIETSKLSGNQWGVTLPSERAPVFTLRYRTEQGDNVRRYINLHNGEVTDERYTLGATGFFFPFHFRLHIQWLKLGYWIVGLAAMGMLVLLVSGVIIHKKIFTDFFTFRPQKAMQRSALDLHNLSGVLALPFHFVITLSGLIIFAATYFPNTNKLVYAGDEAAYEVEMTGRYDIKPTGEPGQLASLDAMLAQASQLWGGGQPYFLRVRNAGDAHAYVEIRRSYEQDVTMNLDTIYFDGISGEVLSRFEAKPVLTVQRYIAGMHFIQFNHWPLRWLYFLAGLSGCILIATGFLFWLEARRVRHAKQGLKGVAIVQGLTIGSVTGIIIATLMFLLANRWLPANAALQGYERDALEAWVFYLSWLATFAHAWLRSRAAWREQAWLISLLALLTVASNAVTTGTPLWQSLAGHDYATAGTDVVLLLGAILAAYAAWKLGQRKSTTQHKKATPTSSSSIGLGKHE